MNQKALKAVVEKSFFYKQNFRALIRILTISIVLNIILLISFVLFLGKQKEQFLAVNTQGQVLALKTSKMPNITQSMLINWVALNITRLYALDFLNYKQQMLSTRILFTNSGWKSFNVAFTPIVDKIVKEKIVQSSVLEGPPVVTAVGLVSGIRSWKLQVPLLINFNKGEISGNLKAIVELTVEATRSGNNLFAISQIIQVNQ